MCAIDQAAISPAILSFRFHPKVKGLFFAFCASGAVAKLWLIYHIAYTVKFLSCSIAVGRSGLAWALASLGVVPDKAWLSQFLATAFADGLAGDKLRCASTLFCLASLDFDSLVEWLGDFLEGKYTAAAAKDASQSGGLDLSLQKYAALVGVLGSLAEMDPKQLRAAWLDQTLPQDW